MKPTSLCRLTVLALTVGAASVIGGCNGGLTLGPTVERSVVLLKAGQPVQILENRTVKARPLSGPEQVVRVDIGGWVAMPPEHFDELMALLPDKKPTLPPGGAQ